MLESQSVEILVHNISHSDVVLSINDLTLSYPKCKVIGRPKFSHFRNITEKVLNTLTVENKIETRKMYKRRGEKEFEASTSSTCDIGFDLRDSPVIVEDVSSLRFRRDDRSLLASDDREGCFIDGIYFPLLAILVPKWLSFVATRKANVRFIIILVSGRGTPIDSSARIVDNSTEQTGKLMKHFLNMIFPDIEVVPIHSDSNLFRYDENIVFVKSQLQPYIDNIRNDLAKKNAAKWRDHLRVSLSFADGSSARVSAINASLRHYRPSYMHFWQLKTFWCENEVYEDDIEFHSFEEISTEPAISLNLALKTNESLVVAEMKKFKEDFEKIRMSETSNDLASFWLRKSKKPVLSVLLVQKDDDSEPKLYRGTNMEVSMPTGSLCAERNVIGTALAADMSLRRQDLKMIAVFAATSLEVEPDRSLGFIDIPTTDATSDSSAYEIGESSVIDADGDGGSASPNSCRRKLATDISGSSSVMGSESLLGGSLGSPSSGHKRKIMVMGESDSSSTFYASSSSMESHSIKPSIPVKDDAPASAVRINQGRRLRSSEYSLASPLKTSHSSPSLQSPAPLPFTSLCSSQMHASSKRIRLLTSVPKDLSALQGASSGCPVGGGMSTSKSTPCLEAYRQESLLPTAKPEENGKVNVFYIVAEENDMNPLKPCGACSEWLKKIAEVNPSFSVLTFSDCNFTGVYCQQIQD